MTYLELANESAHDLDRGKITLGEYEERIKPLCDEIKPWNGWISTSERLPENAKTCCSVRTADLLKKEFILKPPNFTPSGKGL